MLEKLYGLLPLFALKRSSSPSVPKGLFGIVFGNKHVFEFEVAAKERTGDNNGAKWSLTTEAGDIAFPLPSMICLYVIYLKKTMF